MIGADDAFGSVPTISGLRGRTPSSRQRAATSADASFPMRPRSYVLLGSGQMSWCKIDQARPPIGRPVLVRTVEDEKPTIAFLGPDGLWYSGGALVQSSTTLLGATPTDWCEPDGEAAL